MPNLATTVGVTVLFVGGLGFAMAYSANKSDLQFNPGLWESTTTTTSSIAGTESHTETQCMKADDFDPNEIIGDLLDSLDSGDCSTDKDNTADTVSIEMSCEMEGGSIDMSGYFTFSGNEGSGAMDMKIDVQGMTMDMEFETVSRRIGDC